MDSDCSHEIKKHLFLRRKAMKNVDSVLKSREITLPTKVCLVKAMVFPVIMYGRESWTIKKAERQRTDAFKLWCWRRFLRVPWIVRRSNQLIQKEINPEYLLEGLMLKLLLLLLLSHFSRVQLFATPWTAARQASLCIINSRSLLKLTSIELDMEKSKPLCTVTENVK